jgi:hypothetical protein
MGMNMQTVALGVVMVGGGCAVIWIAAQLVGLMVWP